MRIALRWGGFVAALLAFILVPFAVFGDAMDRWAASVLSSGTPAALPAALLVAGLLASDVVLPIPSSFVSTAAGALLGFLPGAAVGWTGMSLACAFGYWLGSRGRPAASGLVREADLDRIEALLERHGSWALGAVRPVPVLAEASLLVAGVVRLDRRVFYGVTLAANAGISLAYAWIGAFAAEARSFLLAFSGAILLPLLAMGVVRLLGGRRTG